ncbi:unnamed protein product [Ambrosiozyma monospora]|uniref:Unnamed protein product n=1 Tax=Ambrosiozyma monospora TaxID=43982 RepID=A0ACB5SWQ1_AMBMO|nr:unnamed protein product [Ambrosiozyma monospora]
MKMIWSKHAPILDKFIHFVIEKSVQLSSIEVFMLNEDSDHHLSNPDIMRLVQFHTDVFCLRLSDLRTKDFYLKFVNSLYWTCGDITDLHHSALLNKLTALTELFAEVRRMEDIILLESILKDLQTASRSLKRIYLRCCFYGVPEESYAGVLEQANSFILKHQNLNIQCGICFSDIEVGTGWRLDSKSEFALPINTVYPTNTKDIHSIKQWCSASGICDLNLNAKSTPFPQNPETISFIKMSNSTVSTMTLKNFSTEYMLYLDGFSSLRELEIRDSAMNKFPSLPESLRDLKIVFVSEPTMSNVDHCIVLPPRLCVLSLCGNRRFLTLPVVLNIDELHDLKKVSVHIYPLQLDNECDELLYDLKDSVTRNFLRVSNTCTIDQLQRFLFQLPSDLKNLSIVFGDSGSGYIEDELNNNTSICSFDTLSLGHFENLEHLEIEGFNNNTLFNASILPAAQYLEFTAPRILTGCFTHGIRFLYVDLQSCEESLTHFLDHFISKLASLVFLSVSVDSFMSADLRNVIFPHQLCSLQIEFYSSLSSVVDTDPNRERLGSIVLDNLPVQLNILELRLRGRQDIIVDDSKGERISCIAKRIAISDGEANWIQYSRFEGEEESFGIEILYAS